jgi:hypothetical protein
MLLIKIKKTVALILLLLAKESFNKIRVGKYI